MAGMNKMAFLLEIGNFNKNNAIIIPWSLIKIVLFLLHKYLQVTKQWILGTKTLQNHVNYLIFFQ